MKINFGYLNSLFFNGELSKSSAQKLIDIGIEYEEVSSELPKSTKATIVEIIKITKHPNADKLRICDVFDGKQLHSIVCGAKNPYVGMRTVLVKPGAILPNGFIIEAKKIRGTESRGMLCSAQELGLGIDDIGIIELPQKTICGIGFYDYIKDSCIGLDLEIYPNRGDCMSYIGIAREFQAATGIKMVTQSNSYKNILKKQMPTQYRELKKSREALFTIRSGATEIAKHFLAVSAKVTSLPVNIALPYRLALEKCGVRSISPLIDIANLVSAETGQPIHIYDAEKVNGPLIVRFAKDGEVFNGLNKAMIALRKKDIVIADKNQALALAGILGGESSMVTSTTNSIIIEIAHFDAATISKTSTQHAIQTEASMRFSRGVTPYTISHTCSRIFELCNLCGVVIDPTTIRYSAKDIPATPRKRSVSISIKKVNRLLGTSLSKAKMKQSLKRIAIASSEVKSDQLRCDIPYYRHDLHTYQDVSEEVARMYGYNNIKPRNHSNFMLPPKKEGAYARYHQIVMLKRQLQNMRYIETIHYSFIASNHGSVSSIKIKNPLSSKLAVLRESLLHSLIETDKKNRNHHNPPRKIYEVGNCYYQKRQALCETEVLAGLFPSDAIPKSWQATDSSSNSMFYRMKQELSELYKQPLRAVAVSQEQIKECFHPGRSATLQTNSGKAIFHFGELHPHLTTQLPKGVSLYYFAGEINPLLQPKKSYEFISPPDFPAITRDISLVVRKSYQYSDVKKAITNLAISQITGIALFDYYQLPAETNAIRYGITLTLTPQIKTFTQIEIENIMNKLISALQNSIKAVLHDGSSN